MSKFWHPEARVAFTQWAQLQRGWSIKFCAGQYIEFIRGGRSERYSVERLATDRWRLLRYDHHEKSRALEYRADILQDIPAEYSEDGTAQEVIIRLGSIISDIARDRKVNTKRLRLELRMLARSMGSHPESNQSLEQIARALGTTKVNAFYCGRQIQKRYMASFPQRHQSAPIGHMVVNRVRNLFPGRTVTGSKLPIRA